MMAALRTVEMLKIIKKREGRRGKSSCSGLEVGKPLLTNK